MAGEVAATGNLSTDAAHAAHWEAFWQRSFIDILRPKRAAAAA